MSTRPFLLASHFYKRMGKSARPERATFWNIRSAWLLSIRTQENEFFLALFVTQTHFSTLWKAYGCCVAKMALNGWRITIAE